MVWQINKALMRLIFLRHLCYDYVIIDLDFCNCLIIECNILMLYPYSVLMRAEGGNENGKELVRN